MLPFQQAPDPGKPWSRSFREYVAAMGSEAGLLEQSVIIFLGMQSPVARVR